MKDKFIKGLKWFFNSYIWLGVLLLALDIVSKNIIVQNSEYIKSVGQYHSQFGSSGIDLIPGFLGITYVINEKIAFGISIGSAQTTQIIFSIVAIAVAIGIIIYLIKKWDKTNSFYKATLMMIIAGALGNVIDRIFYSPEYLNYINSDGQLARGVVDFIDFYGIWGYNFNIADSSVVVAAIMLIVYVIVTEIIDYNKTRKAELAKEKEQPKEVMDTGKVLSKSEREKLELLEKDKDDHE